jgi:hypothetical protein
MASTRERRQRENGDSCSFEENAVNGQCPFDWNTIDEYSSCKNAVNERCSFDENAVNERYSFDENAIDERHSFVLVERR